MAASDARPVPKRNIAYRAHLRFWDASTGKPWSGTLNDLAATVSLDDGSFASTTNAPVQIGTSSWCYIDLTNGEQDAYAVLIEATASNSNAYSDGWECNPQLDGDIVVNLSNGYHGGYSAQIQLQYLNVNTDSGTAVNIQSTSGNAIQLTASSGNCIDLYATSGSGVAGHAIYAQSASNDCVVLYPGSNYNGIHVYGGQSSGAAIRVETAGNANAVEIIGGYEGHGIYVSGGSGGEGDTHGIYAVGGQSNGRGVYIAGINYGPGLQIDGGTYGAGVAINAGTSGSYGLSIVSPGSHGVFISAPGAAGIHVEASGNAVELSATSYALYLYSSSAAALRIEGAQNGVEMVADNGQALYLNATGGYGIYSTGSAGGALFLGAYGIEVVGSSYQGLYVQSYSNDAAVFYPGSDNVGIHVWGGWTSGSAFKMSTNGSGYGMEVDVHNTGIQISSSNSDGIAINADGNNIDLNTMTELAQTLLNMSDGVESGLTLKQAIQVAVAALAGKTTGVQSGAPKFRDTGDSLDRISATIDGNGNRSSVTLNI